jgi:hypothetical protein
MRHRPGFTLSMWTGPPWRTGAGEHRPANGGHDSVIEHAGSRRHGSGRQPSIHSGSRWTLPSRSTQTTVVSPVTRMCVPRITS